MANAGYDIHILQARLCNVSNEFCKHVFSRSGRMVTSFTHPQTDIISKRAYETTLLLLLSNQDALLVVIPTYIEVAKLDQNIDEVSSGV